MSIFDNGEEKSMSYQEGSRVNRSVMQGKKQEKVTIVIYGPKCFEPYEKLNLFSLWAKTSAVSLIKTMEASLSQSVGIWNMRATKYNRFYCQLVPLEHRTKDTEFSLLPTPKTLDYHDQRDLTNGKNISKTTGKEYGVHLCQLSKEGLLTTPRAAAARGNCSRDRGKGNLEDYIAKNMLPTPLTQGLKICNEKGQSVPIDLTRLPTPTAASDRKGCCTRKDKKRQNDTLAHSIHGLLGEPGKTSQLNHRFVAEMMGFPPDWTESPFQQNIEHEL